MDGAREKEGGDDDELPKEIVDAIEKAYRESRSVLDSIAFKLCRNDQKKDELVANGIGDLLMKRRTFVVGVAAVTQIVNTMGTLWSNEVTIDKRRRGGKRPDQLESPTLDPENALDAAEHDAAFGAEIARVKKDLGEDKLAIHALDWLLDDEGESLSERAARLGVEAAELTKARKRALYAARKVFDVEGWKP